MLGISYMMIQTNITVISKQHTMMELMTLILGAFSIYLLLFAILLIPLSLIAWFLIRIIRNVKERKDPLLSLEGRCDL